MPALTSHSERVRVAGSRMASRALSILLPSGPGACLAEAVEAENVGLASAMAGAALDFGYGLHAVVDVQFAEDLMQVVFYGIGTDTQNTADLGIGLAFSDPAHDFGFALAQPEVFATGRGGKQRRAARVRQGGDPAKRIVKIGQQDFHGVECGIVESLLRTENHVQAIVLPALVADAVQERGVHALQGFAKRTLQTPACAQHAGFS